MGGSAANLESPGEHSTPTRDQRLGVAPPLPGLEDPERASLGSARVDRPLGDRAADLLVRDEHQAQGWQRTSAKRDQIERFQERDDSAFHVDGAGGPEPILDPVGARRREDGVEVSDEEKRSRQGRMRGKRSGLDDRKRDAAVVRLVAEGDFELAPPQLRAELVCHPPEIGLVFALTALRRKSFEELDRFGFEF